MNNLKAKLRFVGTGTSQGVPIIGCNCRVCTSPAPEDKRFRSSALIEYGGLRMLVDAGPDFRSQMLAAGVKHLDAILLTHNHKDHTGGLDDVRSLNYIDRKAVEIYCEERVIQSLRNEYAYAFAEQKYPGAPEWHVHRIDEKPFRIWDNLHVGELEWIHDKGYFFREADGSLRPSDNRILPAEAAAGTASACGESGGRYWVDVVPIRGYHDTMPVLGFRFGDIAYITDMSRLPEEELPKLQGLKHLSLNTVGYKPHHSHFSLDEALELAKRIGAEHCWLTHLSHSFPCHSDFVQELERLCKEKGIPGSVLPAHDGLVLE